MAHLLSAMFELWSSVPVLTEKDLRHSFSRHRKGWGFRLATVATFREPQKGQATPLGQRCPTNHASAFSSVSNCLVASIKVMPFR